ncbi:MAG: hypothetical protein DRJ03_30885 [Chloroflexi bacterium]|nr:MAG: hypothetical protein DRJ03_30885 [Chloroflexota bacterium]
MRTLSHYRAGLWHPYEKPMYGALLNPYHPLAQGLIGCWLFNEGGGNTVFDLSQYMHHGSINGATWTIEKFGSILSFDGTDDYIEVPDQNQELAPDSLTFAARIKVSGFVENDRIVTKKTNLNWDASTGWSLELNIEEKMTFLGSGGTYGDKLSMGWQQDKWFFVAVTKESGATTVKGYLDGQYKDNQACDTISPNAQPLALAVYQTQYTPIIYSEVYIYNRALSAEEIWQLYTDPFCMFYHSLEAEVLYAVAPPAGIVPQAMHHYRMMREV